jgi:spore coat polysaccharide biosynthesis predicted glycosyltransferase SpsG
MIIFRADVSPRTGLQHVRCCAYLASLLKKNSQVLICSREDKKTSKFLAERSIPTALGKDPGAMDLAGVTAVIFDLPHFSAPDSALLEKAKKAGIKTFQIVPPGGETQPVDFQVAGAEFALLHHKFRHFNQAKRKYHKNIKNIFINLGNLLPYRDLRAVVDTLHRLRFKMKIAPGLDLKKADKRNLMKIYPGIHFCGKSESPARAYFEADLALVPAGEEAWEAAVVGTPALYMPMEKGDDAWIKNCSRLGIGIPFPSLPDLSVQFIRDVLVPLALEHRQQMGEAGKKLVDGLGVQRFFKILKENGIIV